MIVVGTHHLRSLVGSKHLWSLVGLNHLWSLSPVLNVVTKIPAAEKDLPGSFEIGKAIVEASGIVVRFRPSSLAAVKYLICNFMWNSYLFVKKE